MDEFSWSVSEDDYILSVTLAICVRRGMDGDRRRAMGQCLDNRSFSPQLVFAGQGGGLANSFEFVWGGIHGLLTLLLCCGGVVCMHVLRNLLGLALRSARVSTSLWLLAASAASFSRESTNFTDNNG